MSPNSDQSAHAATQAFAYRAARQDGSLERGTIRACDRAGAVTALGERGLMPFVLTARRAAGDDRRSVSQREMALGLRVLADYLQAGLPLSRALASLDDRALPAWRRALPSLRTGIRDGRSFAAALLSCPMRVPALVVGIVEAGEAGSGLADAVRRAADVMEESAATRAALRAALAYPALLAAAGASAIVFLVGVVLPRFAAMLADNKQQLPASTRIVLGATNLLRSNAVAIAVALAVLIVAWHLWASTLEGQRRWHAVLLRLPLIGGVRRAAATSRICLALAALVGGGVTIALAIGRAVGAAGDAALAARWLEARDRIVRGESIAASIEATGAATPGAVRLLRAGEDTGRLAAMLDRAARLEREQAVRATSEMVRLVEPALIVSFGAIVALVAASLLQALYSVRPVA